jgi:hypothetical protein
MNNSENLCLLGYNSCSPLKVGVVRRLHLQDRNLRRERNQRESRWQKGAIIIYVIIPPYIYIIILYSYIYIERERGQAMA